MKDDPFDLMPLYQLAAIGLYVLIAMCIVPVAAVALTPITAGWARPARVACGNCGYRMPAIERHCPECRSAVR